MRQRQGGRYLICSKIKILICVFLSWQGNCKEDSLASYELICSLQSLIISVEQLQASFLLNPEKYTDELATQPRRLLNTLRYSLLHNFRILI